MSDSIGEIKPHELTPGTYYLVKFKNSDDIYTVLATSNAQVQSFTRNEVAYRTTGNIMNAVNIVPISEHQAKSGKLSKQIQANELVPGCYYQATFKIKSTQNVYTAKALSNNRIETLTCNGKEFKSTGTFMAAYTIIAISEELAKTGGKKLSNKEAVRFLEKEW